MLNLGLISFGAPWVLAAAVALPIVWLLLRLTPPAVRQIHFPAARLLFDLDPTQRTTAQTPPWLIILRIGLLALALLGLAEPVFNVNRSERSGPLVVVLDTGWASATHWEQRMRSLRDLLESADRRGEQAVVVTTAPAPAGETSEAHLSSARDVLSRIGHIAPLPWASDRVQAAEQVKALPLKSAGQTVWISDGVAGEGTDDLAAALAKLGPLTVIDADTMPSAMIVYPPERKSVAGSEATSSTIDVPLARVGTDGYPATMKTVRALDAQGQVVAHDAVTFGGGATKVTAHMSIPSELANQVTRFDVEGVTTAAATALLDDRWQRRPVGIASATTEGIRAPLLENAYYLKEAMGPYADVRSGDLDTLFERPLAVLVMADGGRILDAELQRLNAWVTNGGLLIRFAGPALEGNVDTLLPVKLREGDRALGGAMSWTQPAGLAPFPENSPFKGLLVPDDVTVQTQILAEPAADLQKRTWASLKDGTPLVTARAQGQGWIVLFHVSATPEWSKLPLSGLFVNMLRRMVDISHGLDTGAGDLEGGEGALAPNKIMDAFGRLTVPSAALNPIAAGTFTETKPSPLTPPGLYGPHGGTHALNLSSSLTDMEALTRFPSSATRASFTAVVHERPLKPWLLVVALLLLLADLIVSYFLRRLLPERGLVKTGAAASLAVLLLVAAHPARAAEAVKRDIDAATKAAILDTRLAYIATGSADVDRVANAGLDALTHLMAERTAAEFATPAKIDMNGVQTPDVLIPYPLIYWRITTNSALPSDKALAAVNTYLHRGGMVIFDAPEQVGSLGGGGWGDVTKRLEALLRKLDIPPVVKVSDDHVLNRSFYLMRGLPGRYTTAPVLVERASAANDGASSVVIGGNDWVSAWAKDASGAPLYAAVPGGEAQREQAFRAGVNMVMYALTGNYKSDQVHLPAIMQRLTQ